MKEPLFRCNSPLKSQVTCIRSLPNSIGFIAGCTSGKIAIEYRYSLIYDSKRLKLNQHFYLAVVFKLEIVGFSNPKSKKCRFIIHFSNVILIFC